MSRSGPSDTTATSPELTQTATLLHSASIQLLRTLREEDAATGIGPAQLSALSVLVFGGPRTIGALAQTEQVSGPTMTRVVDGLVAIGLARRRADALDRRIVNVRASAKGQRLLILGRDRRVAKLTAALRTLNRDQLTSVKATATILAALFKRP